MNELKLNYTCTDPDCAQYMAKVTDTRYSYIEYREWFGNYIVCHAVVDLQDYTLDENCVYLRIRRKNDNDNDNLGRKRG